MENNTFKFRDDLYKPENGDTVPIELLTGPYSGVIYRYVRINVQEKNNGEAVMRFQYELLNMGNHTETSLRKDPLFTEHIGLLLNHLILEAAEANSANRESDTEKSSEERDLHS